jgi:hypothetical protein
MASIAFHPVRRWAIFYRLKLRFQLHLDHVELLVKVFKDLDARRCPCHATTVIVNATVKRLLRLSSFSSCCSIVIVLPPS